MEPPFLLGWDAITISLTLAFCQSILTHIPRQADFSRTRLFVLLYAPGLKPGVSASIHPPLSLSSSYSNIGPEQLATPSGSPETPVYAYS